MFRPVRFSLLAIACSLPFSSVLDGQDFSVGQKVVVIEATQARRNGGAVSDAWIGMPAVVREKRVVARTDGTQEPQTLIEHGAQSWIPTRFLRTPEKALAYFEKQMKKNGDETLQYAKGITLGTLGRYQEAVACFDQLLAKEPNSVSYLNERAAILTYLKEYKRAEDDFSKIIELKPDNAIFYNNRAICRRYLGELASARSDLGKAIELDPTMLSAYKQIKDIELKSGNRKEAIAVYDRMVKNNPTIGQAYLLRSDLHLSLKNRERALEDIERYVELVPNHFRPQLNRAILLRDVGRVKESQRALDRLAQLFPDEQAVYINRGIAYENLGEFDLAIADINKAIELSEQHRPFLLFHRATAALGKKNYLSAIEDLNRVIELDPKTMAFVRRGEAHFATNGFDAAFADFSRALDLDQNQHYSRYHRAKILEMQGKDQEALAEYQTLIEKGLRNGSVYYARGHVLKRQKKWAAALADLEQAVKQSPQEVDFLNDLAWSLATLPEASLRNPSKAISVATQACKLSQWKRGLVLDTLATAHAANGDFNKAVEVMDRALQLDDAKGRKDLLERRKLFEKGKRYIAK